MHSKVSLLVKSKTRMQKAIGLNNDLDIKPSDPRPAYIFNTVFLISNFTCLPDSSMTLDPI